MVISFVPSAIAPELEAVAATKRHNIFHEESEGGGGKGYARREGGVDQRRCQFSQLQRAATYHRRAHSQRAAQNRFRDTLRCEVKSL